ncbi:response regulator [Pseudomonas fuscovaginae UPB0736]|uniref:CheY chemotaxis protein or a CheY-like REC (Receiver) domain n=1 Tax=Pseudomonas asplenii TaxID=53407 RepID=A0A1H2A557_9PSED|nr:MULTISPECIES: response regulator [Pseudomonas]UUQ65960.1 response regulator [Pseudomonas fuscovaginae UPB0736]UZE30816.1 response regulator [Pseudomonas asplenii]SDT41060.1 CheY chemotaxis protein or a CheY-like REC (receiver) domain [Pseudomonas asplenii]SEI15307.1 CheY chemotaxis protein or a CheY-like REC (receiver) domain [Pseudomonas fuscovaginae]
MPKENLRVLLVEDHPFQLAATQSLLHSYGFHLLTPASNATEALRAMEATPTPFDLMLCDQCLPDIPGLELIHRANQRGKIRQAILLSSLSLEELRILNQTALLRHIPLLGCLSKPLNGLALKSVLGSRGAS